MVLFHREIGVTDKPTTIELDSEIIDAAGFNIEMPIIIRNMGNKKIELVQTDELDDAFQYVKIRFRETLNKLSK